MPASNKYNNQNVKAVKPRLMSAYIGIKTYEQDARQPAAKQFTHCCVHNANAILASSRRYVESEKTWKIPKMDEPGPGSYQVEEAIKKSQWAKVKFARQKSEPGTWINQKDKDGKPVVRDVRTRRLHPVDPDPDCKKDHKWEEMNHDKLLHAARDKTTRPQSLTFKRH